LSNLGQRLVATLLTLKVRCHSPGVLSDVSGSFIVKPCTAEEIRFYESIPAHNPDLLHHVPTFMGTLALSSPEEQEALEVQDPMSISAALQAQTANDIPTQPGIQSKPIGAGQALVMENVAFGFTRPNVLDVKLGARLWDDKAPQHKRTKLDAVAAHTTSGTLGFRIAGMRVWKRPRLVGADWQCDVYGKAYGRSFTKDKIRGAFDAFFCPNPAARPPTVNKCNMMRRCDALVAGLQEALETQDSRMYSSSILVVCEADDDALQRALDREAESYARYKRSEVGGNQDSYVAQTPDDDDNGEDESEDGEEEHKTLSPICRVKLIDFAHAEWTPGSGPDENTLSGIRNLRLTLQAMITATDAQGD